MSFTETYLEKCVKARHLWFNKKPVLGDYFIDLNSSVLDFVCTHNIAEFSFDADHVAFVPSLDDLLEIFNNQLRAFAAQPEQVYLELRHDPAPDNRWWAIAELNDEFGEVRSVGTSTDSIHDAMMNLLTQIAPRKFRR